MMHGLTFKEKFAMLVIGASWGGLVVAILIAAMHHAGWTFR